MVNEIIYNKYIIEAYNNGDIICDETESFIFTPLNEIKSLIDKISKFPNNKNNLKLYNYSLDLYKKLNNLLLYYPNLVDEWETYLINQNNNTSQIKIISIIPNIIDIVKSYLFIDDTVNFTEIYNFSDNIAIEKYINDKQLFIDHIIDKELNKISNMDITLLYQRIYFLENIFRFNPNEYGLIKGDIITFENVYNYSSEKQQYIWNGYNIVKLIYKTINDNPIIPKTSVQVDWSGFYHCPIIPKTFTIGIEFKPNHWINIFKSYDLYLDNRFINKIQVEKNIEKQFIGDYTFIGKIILFDEVYIIKIYTQYDMLSISYLKRQSLLQYKTKEEIVKYLQEKWKANENLLLTYNENILKLII